MTNVIRVMEQGIIVHHAMGLDGANCVKVMENVCIVAEMDTIDT